MLPNRSSYEAANSQLLSAEKLRETLRDKSSLLLLRLNNKYDEGARSKRVVFAFLLSPI